MSFRHRLGHWFAWFHATIETWTETCARGDVLMVGYRCEECGELYGVHEAEIGRWRK